MGRRAGVRVVIFAALVNHGQELQGVPITEWRACGLVIAGVLLAVGVRLVLLHRS